MKFGQLRTGDVVTMMGTTSVIMAIEKPHPRNPSFILVAWYLFGERRMSFDMLHPDWEVLPGTSVTDDGFYAFDKAASELGEIR